MKYFVFQLDFSIFLCAASKSSFNKLLDNLACFFILIYISADLLMVPVSFLNHFLETISKLLSLLICLFYFPDF